MPTSEGIWLRREVAPNEQRTPLVPADAAKLIAEGIPVTVEESPHRAFPADAYAAVGCTVVPGDTWPDAPPTDVVLGLKEPSTAAVELTHRHVLFGHAYKGQVGGPPLLRRFGSGGGTLLDLEYLTDGAGRRVVAFGHWAGYVGAGLAALRHGGLLEAPLRSWTLEGFDALLKESRAGARALVIGARGRSGRGAVAALGVAGATVTAWDIEETGNLDRAALLGHDILVNTVFATEPGTPFLGPDDLADPGRRLSVVSDVTCDVTSECNRLPVYDRVTEWSEPVRRLHDAPPLDLIAIDNLPSLLPRESSTAFSEGLLPHLATVHRGDGIWGRCEEHYHHARRATKDK
ncbi:MULTISPECIES: saccharopine dehydrogenase [unclassified Streptomyces]|uniref:saccharopine dehydrogenase n=1 Tax=unclassified Streptomyces TaxID=2593676 RepID=UPI0022586918|nr:MULTISPECIES: saccharopine dehydrogenase [unclassified Streptomyces]MCX5143870.1 saccharopine dehydrogenase [Streptomyces sp. NBC_00338]WRZ68285.1 saccharopine dehydrogenase [Streptomyces sp. NBC_01257]